MALLYSFCVYVCACVCVRLILTFKSNKTGLTKFCKKTNFN